MLRTKLFRAFALLVILFSALSGYLGIRTIAQRVVQEAQTRARLGLSSAWAIHDGKLKEIETIVRLAAAKEMVIQACEAKNWKDADLQSRLERIRATFQLEFLDVISPDGQVMIRTTPPHAIGDYRVSDPAVMAASQGQVKSCVEVLSRSELEKEADGLADRAFLEIENTKYSRISEKKSENRGMVMVAAAPVRSGDRITAVIYGGILVNRNNDLVDHIRDVVFKNETPVGTATIFLDDSRIATTVRLQNGNRAIGTRVSKEVAERVLDNGGAWVGNAFVVSEWYLSAYEPIRDGAGRVVGMLYVGILKEPFDKITQSIVYHYVLISVVTLLFGLMLAFFMAGRIATPIHRLVEAANRMSKGDPALPVPIGHATCRETERLILAFNEMTSKLAEREERLKALNRSYMETLGFVSHELKSPVATIMNYVYLMRQSKLGPMTEKQEKAMRIVDMNSLRLVEMVRHYLNLARIENGELNPILTRVEVVSDVIAPLLDSAEADIEARRITVVNHVTGELVLDADINMVREIFENLISNAVKYGREGGQIILSAAVEGSFAKFSVKNDGEAIPPEKFGSLFKKFSRLESSPTGLRQKGTGLGLFITKSIVEAHGGKIEVTSTDGGWTDFIFTLPLLKSDAEASSRPA